MTIAEQEFATQNHNLVFSFLNENNLDETDFYDVIIFGFLKAVKNYLTNTRLHQYTFSTIAFKEMRSSLSKHYEEQNRKKRKATTVSLDALILNGGEYAKLKNIVFMPDSQKISIETDLLMIELSSMITRKELDILRMRVDGYALRDIAGFHSIAMKDVKEILTGVKSAVFSVCYK